MSVLTMQADRHEPTSLQVSEHGACPCCLARQLSPVLSIRNVPTNSCLMLESAEEARAFPRGDIELMFCDSCGFVFNRAFDPQLTEYSERYEPTQAYSPTFLTFHRALAERLIETLGLRGKSIVEVGCGQGEFLHLLCRLGGNSGIGFDPCLDGRREDVVAERAGDVRLVGDFFSDVSVKGLTADLLLSKMTLEHIPAAEQFIALVGQVARNSGTGMQTFIQVPESERIFVDCAFWDIYYEHCNYFTETSLKRLLARHGFQVEETTREYDGQYLAVVGRHVGGGAAGGDAGEVARLRNLVETFRTTFARTIEGWRRQVAERVDGGGRVVIWGSGSKGVSFLGALGTVNAEISQVVDINPHRQGKFMVGTGHPIVAPADLQAAPPSTVIVLNPVYKQEVTDLLSGLGVHPEILAL